MLYCTYTTTSQPVTTFHPQSKFYLWESASVTDGENLNINIIHWDPGRNPVTISWPLTPPFYHTCTYRGFLSSPAAMVPLLSLRAKVWGLRFVNPLIGSLDAGAAPCFPTGLGGGCWFDAPSVVVWGLGLPGKGWQQTRFIWRVKSSLLIWRNHWNTWFSAAKRNHNSSDDTTGTNKGTFSHVEGCVLQKHNKTGIN